MPNMVKIITSTSTEIHSGYLEPNNYTDNVEFWSGPYMYDFLYTLGIVQSSVVAEALEDIYFYDWQIGSQEDMTPGMVDVSIFVPLELPYLTSARPPTTNFRVRVIGVRGNQMHGSII